MDLLIASDDCNAAKPRTAARAGSAVGTLCTMFHARHQGADGLEIRLSVSFFKPKSVLLHVDIATSTPRMSINVKNTTSPVSISSCGHHKTLRLVTDHCSVISHTHHCVVSVLEIFFSFVSLFQTQVLTNVICRVSQSRFPHESRWM